MELVNEIKALISAKKKKELRKKVIDSYPYDVAKGLCDLELGEIKYLFKCLDIKLIANILEYMEVNDVVELFEHIKDNEVAAILINMEMDDAIDIIKSLSNEKKSRISLFIPKKKLASMKELASFNEDEAGSIMTNNYFVVTMNSTVPSIMEKLIKEGSEKEVIDTIFVVNEKNEFVGLIDLKQLIIARKDTDIKSIINTKIISCQVHTKIVLVSQVLKQRSLLVLPVLDNKVLKGIITIDDIMDFVDEDMKDDYDKLAGLSGENDTKILNVFKSRIPWLCILMILSFIISTILGLFEEVIASATVLVFFQTMILDMGGNAGTQSLASSVIELSNNTKQKKFGKELLSGLIISLILGCCSFIITFVFMLIKGNINDPIAVAIVIGLSMLCGVFISNLSGFIIPKLLHKLHIDPAVASGPFISTINDVMGVVIYYTIAYIILIQGGLL